MELEGFEPSSKRGTNVLSTCLFACWFLWRGRQATANRTLSLCCFRPRARLLRSYSRFICTALSISLGTTTIGRCLVPATVAGIKPIYCTSIRQQERSCFRHLKLAMSQIIERSHHCSACLHTTSTRCQNRSAPICLAEHSPPGVQACKCVIFLGKITAFFSSMQPPARFFSQDASQNVCKTSRKKHAHSLLTPHPMPTGLTQYKRAPEA